jgi:predicted nucleotidyltransferase component of viral defense system
MIIDERTRTTLARTSGATGISALNLEKELQLMSLVGKVFDAINDAGFEAALFGGTALNKGYYAEKQRFSKDLDVDLFVKSLVDAKPKLERELQKIEGFTPKLEHSGKDAVVWSFPYGPNPWENVLLETRKAPLSERPIKVELHSILEYQGIPVSPVRIPSYSLEYLLARKVIALSRRAIGKDVYDTYTGFLLRPDMPKLKIYVRRLAGEEPVAANALHWIELIRPDSADITELTETVPLAYRTSLASMLEEVKDLLQRLL